MKHLGDGIKVGVLALVVAVLGFGTWKTVSERASGAGGFTLRASFRDASGLAGKSRVVIAGLTIGEITDRRLDGRNAIVAVRVRRGTQIYSNAIIFKKSSSLLGEFYLEIDPGAPQTVDADAKKHAHRLLRDGEEIATVVEATTPDDLIRGVNQTLPNVNLVLTEVRGLAADMRSLVGGRISDIAATVDAELKRDADLLNSILARADSVLAGVDEVVGDVRGMTSDSRVGGILGNIEGAAADARALIGSTKEEIGATGKAVRDRLAALDEAIARASSALTGLDEMVSSARSVAGKLDSDQGTLGRLVNDPTLAENLESVTGDARQFASTVFGIQTVVGMRGEFNFFSRALKSYFSLELQTRPDKFYLVEIVKDPRGTLVPRLELGLTGELERSLIVDEAFRFSFQFGRRFDWLTLRIGVKENSGGFGADASLFDGRLDLSFDVYDADFDELPRLKLLVGWTLLRHLHIVAGVDDALNDHAEVPIARMGLTGSEPDTYHLGRDVFGGAMLTFNDQDLSALLFVLGSAMGGATSR